jgi:3-hydroxyisobutyrate dehydrogenase-like beta-hydroxyacid dehydrogenase
MKIGVIGLGTMGQPMARRLARAGHRVSGWNRTRGRADQLAGDGVTLVETPAAAAQAEVLITMVSDDAAVEDIMWPGGTLLTAGVPGLIHVGMSTVGDRLATRLAEAHRAAGQTYISAPVFGPPEAAQSGRLVIAAAGPRTVVERLRPVLSVLGRVDFIGEDPAMANVVKAAGNFLMASVVESLRDAVTLVHAAGADPRQFAGILTQSLFPTPVYQYLGGLLAGRAVQGGPPVPNPFLRAAAQSADAAERLGVSVPIIEQVRDSK